MKKLLVIVVLLVVLGGGGVAAWIFMTGHGETSEVAIHSLVPSGPPVFVDLRPIHLPLVGPNRVQQLVTIKMVVEAADRSAGDRVAANLPRLNDAFMRGLYGMLDTPGLLRPNGLIDVNQLKARVVEISREVLGEGVVNDILVQTMTQRQL